MAELTAQQLEVARLLVDTLSLDEVQPGEIDSDAPLFNTGLGLDSIDALELAVSISREYGFQLRSGDQKNARIFSSLRTLTDYIQEHRASSS
jgi:acyl carrier protein